VLVDVPKCSSHPRAPPPSRLQRRAGSRVPETDAVQRAHHWTNAKSVCTPTNTSGATASTRTWPRRPYLGPRLMLPSSGAWFGGEATKGLCGHGE